MLSLRSNSIACQQAVELVSDYLGGSLGRRDRRRLEAHIRACENCTEYVSQIRLTIKLTARIEPDDLSPAAQVELIELYRRWRSEH